ncbi:MAG: cytochrome c biogenesis protein ResB [Phycisphaerae bacterium]|nr:cytochrome c biogenesis protein ResB [Phycisphaerae bacterium]MDD5380801.1 cytochrome c biogenesis protein ResB [Phycisphaerae bacterium]
MGIEATSKKKLRRAVMRVVPAMVALLIFLSIYGAFLGPCRAKPFFNSPALSVYWLALMALLVTAFAAFCRPIRLPGLFLMHGGCILVLAGALWGSGASLKIQNQLFGTDKIQAGRMIIFKGNAEKRIWLEDSGRIKELPFHIKLNDFRIEYYKPESVRDYISDIQVVKDGSVIAEKSIEVNHPLHFGGYHFHQNSFDPEAHKYTVLSVISDTGLNLVYAGYLSLGIGVFWHFWLRHIFTKQVNGN